MKHNYTTYLYIITDPNTGSVYMGKIQHGNPDLEVVKQSIRADLFGAKCDTSDIILMDVTDRDTEAPDLIVALDGERDALRKEYIEEFRRNTISVLENTYIVTPDGKKHPLPKKK